MNQFFGSMVVMAVGLVQEEISLSVERHRGRLRRVHLINAPFVETAGVKRQARYMCDGHCTFQRLGLVTCFNDHQGRRCC